MRYVLYSSSCDAPPASKLSVIIQKCTGQKFGHCICFAHQAFIYLIKNTEEKKNISIVQQFKIMDFCCNILQNIMYFCNAKLNFEHHYSSLQCHLIVQTSF